MAAAANYAWANRQIITHLTREVFAGMFGIAYEEMPLVYDVTHNVAKREEHVTGGVRQQLIVHRKGATRAFGPETPGLPPGLNGIGQPVLIPGSMGTPSYVLKGTTGAMEKTFGSTCHGSGRVLSRSTAKKEGNGAKIRADLAKKGIYVKATSNMVIAEEAPEAYKSSSAVVDVVHQAGIAEKVARIRPVGVIKG
jgi:tRNA-splicing ligase RtcB